MTRLRPFFNYYGGKYRVAPKYPAPREGQQIIEPFAGSAAYSQLHHQHAVRLIDLDENIVQTWQYLIGVSEAEILSLPDIHEGQTVDDLQIAPEARLLIGWWLNKGSAQPKRRASTFMLQYPAGGPHWGERIRERIAGQVASIRHWSIEQGSYADVDNSVATWFIDPPYAAAGKHYRHGSKGIDYEKLGAWCRARQGQVIVCEADDAAWLPFRHLSLMKGTAGSQKIDPARTEVIWTQDDAPYVHRDHDR
jgi:site-specific DNA-adenine methylase